MRPPRVHERVLPRTDGVVRQFSADRLTDEAYFLARVEVDRDTLAGLDPDVALLPGMPADVMIMTTPRTALDDLLGPVLDSFRRSFQES